MSEKKTPEFSESPISTKSAENVVDKKLLTDRYLYKSNIEALLAEDLDAVNLSPEDEEGIQTEMFYLDKMDTEIKLLANNGGKGKPEEVLNALNELISHTQSRTWLSKEELHECDDPEVITEHRKSSNIQSRGYELFNRVCEGVFNKYEPINIPSDLVELRKNSEKFTHNHFSSIEYLFGNALSDVENQFKNDPAILLTNIERVIGALEDDIVHRADFTGGDTLGRMESQMTTRSVLSGEGAHPTPEVHIKEFTDRVQTLYKLRVIRDGVRDIVESLAPQQKQYTNDEQLSEKTKIEQDNLRPEVQKIVSGLEQLSDSEHRRVYEVHKANSTSTSAMNPQVYAWEAFRSVYGTTEAAAKRLIELRDAGKTTRKEIENSTVDKYMVPVLANKAIFEMLSEEERKEIQSVIDADYRRQQRESKMEDGRLGGGIKTNPQRCLSYILESITTK